MSLDAIRRWAPRKSDDVEDQLTIVLPTSDTMPDILNIVRNEWLDDGATFELIAAMPEIMEKDPRDPHILHHLADLIYGLIAGDVCESQANVIEGGMDDSAGYEYTLRICQDLADRLQRGGEMITRLILRAYSDDFFERHEIIGASLLPTGDLAVKYRRGL